MACDHKFRSFLNLGKLDFEPTTLIVGTFDPEWPVENPSLWFYGRTAENYFWGILPRIHGCDSLINASPDEWKLFCCEHQIAITDLISSISDADPKNSSHQKMLGGYSDNALIHNFDGFKFVNVVALLQGHPSIKNVYFTRGISELFWRHLWNPIAYYCSMHKISQRILLTPDEKALYQFKAYNNLNPDGNISRLEDYLLFRWRQVWHF